MHHSNLEAEGDCASGDSFGYDPLGNITCRSGVGEYSYNGNGHEHAQPQAVTEVSGDNGTRHYEYDAAGNLIDGEYQVQWTAYRKPSRIERGDNIAEFRYGADRNRFWSRQHGTDHDRQTIYIGGRFEREIDHETDTVTDRHHVRARGQVVATVDVTHEDDPEPASRYLTRDHQGSVVMSIHADSEGVYVNGEYRYGVYGNPRDMDRPETIETLLANLPDDRRGYTGHEHLDGVGLIHMNGRVYDPELGRFLSADLFASRSSPASIVRYLLRAARGPHGGSLPEAGVWKTLPCRISRPTCPAALVQSSPSQSRATR